MNMKLYHLIKEDTDSDHITYQKASDIVTKLIKYLFNSDNDSQGLVGIRFRDGKEFLMVRGSTIGLTGEDGRIMFLFGREGFGNRGFFSRSLLSGDPMIAVNQFRFKTLDDVTQVASDVIHKSKIHDTLIHELVHYFDSKRNKTMLSKKEPVRDNEDSVQSYFNSPEEYNAWFTIFAQPLLRFLTDVKDITEKEDRKELASWYGITDDFTSTLKNLQKRSNSKNIDLFLKSLNERNKKALTKRTYMLWKKCDTALNSTENQI
jgi:hypothetical protein